ncbi:hypothetical protein TNCV_2846851 [Trichonephila clavipes]|nr:hypothetical protein TNCV_2846851 [Trichonephila clavipes]
MSYEVQLQRTILYLLAVGEDSLPDSKLVLAENGRGVSRGLHKTEKHGKGSMRQKKFGNLWSKDSHLREEQPPLRLTRVYQPQRPRCFLPGLDRVQLLVDQHHVW